MKIAYVDNEEDIREIVHLSLDSIEGFEVQTFRSSESALKYIPVYRPDFVLLEVNLPGISGLDLFQKLLGRPELSEASFAFLTTQVFSANIAKLETLAPVIPKPFDPMMLPSQVMSLYQGNVHCIAA